MRNKHMIIWVLILTLAASFFTGCDGMQNPTVPLQRPETLPTATAEPTQALQTTETLPPETQAPPQPTEPKPAVLELTRPERFALNSFLSNFSEQWFHEAVFWDENVPDKVFRAETASVSQIVEFAWIFAKLNCAAELEVVDAGEDAYYGFPISVLSPIAERFFDRTLTEAELEAMESQYYVLLDGMVCGPAADGETYTNMTVLDQAYDLGDGTIRAEFTIYDAWAFAEVDGTVFGKDLYYLTGEQAQSDPDLQLHLKGAAVVRPLILEDGEESYRLVSYELYDPTA